MAGPDELIHLVHDRAACSRSRSRRVLVGLTGPPGAGKSTLAGRVAERLDGIVVPMDGFHLANDELDRRGLRSRKGAPETFDADAFVALVTRLKNSDADLPAPSFDRTLDEPVPDAIRVPAETRVVVVEGNYLLLDQSPWDRLRDLLDVVAYIDLDHAIRVRRLVDRHVRHGRTQADAERFVAESDEANARLIEASAHRTDLRVAGT